MFVIYLKYKEGEVIVREVRVFLSYGNYVIIGICIILDMNIVDY